jgi:hypothetical protein
MSQRDVQETRVAEFALAVLAAAAAVVRIAAAGEAAAAFVDSVVDVEDSHDVAAAR